jgi:hypothetical protein
MKTTAHEVNAMIEASYAANAKGTTDFGLKLIDIMRTTLRQPLASRTSAVFLGLLDALIDKFAHSRGHLYEGTFKEWHLVHGALSHREAQPHRP